MTSTDEEPSFPYVLVTTGLVISLLMAALSTYVVPRLAAAYTNFGTELPVLTTFALNYYFLTWLLPLTVIGIALFWPDRSARGMMCMLVGAFGSVVLFLALQASAYWPVFRMGAVSQ